MTESSRPTVDPRAQPESSPVDGNGHKTSAEPQIPQAPSAPTPDHSEMGDSSSMIMPPSPPPNHPSPPGHPLDNEEGGTSEPTQPPPSVGRQVAQLVVIPAVIVVICLGLAFLFGTIAGAKDSLDNHLLKLRQSSGAGKLKFGLQDPRYKDRGLAAYNIATMIPSVTDPVERKRLSDELIDILNHHVTDDEQVLQFYLLMAIGQLGQDGGLDVILDQLDAPGVKAREGAIGGVLSWPDQDQAKRAVGGLTLRLADESPVVRAEAAAALGQLAEPGDRRVIEALKDAMVITDLTMREAQWNAAVALARLGEPQGQQFIAAVLLDRQALAALPAGETGPLTQKKMTGPMIERIMLTTLAALKTAPDPLIRDKIRQIADNDPSATVRNAAMKALNDKTPR